MKVSFTRARWLGLALTCAAAGAGATALVNASAQSTAPANRAGAPQWHRPGHAPLLRRAVHGELVVPNGTRFSIATFDRGKVDSVQGRRLTLTEGTRTTTYKQVTLEIPATATIRNNHGPITLDQIRPGERVMVVQGPRGTLVFAHRPSPAGPKGTP